MGYYEKFKQRLDAIKQLYNVWKKAVDEYNNRTGQKLVVPNELTGKYVTMFKTLVREFDVKLVEKALFYYYTEFMTVKDQIDKLKRKSIPSFDDFFINRVDIIGYINSVF